MQILKIAKGVSTISLRLNEIPWISSLNESEELMGPQAKYRHTCQIPTFILLKANHCTESHNGYDRDTRRMSALHPKNSSEALPVSNNEGTGEYQLFAEICLQSSENRHGKEENDKIDENIRCGGCDESHRTLETTI